MTNNLKLFIRITPSQLPENIRNFLNANYSKAKIVYIDKIKDELYLGERTVINLYNDFIIEITLLAIKNGLIHI